MAKANGSKSFFKTYGFLIFMLTGIVAGCLVGAFAPNFGKKIEFLGTLFINMMFCVVVPMVFCSIASAIANMKSDRILERCAPILFAGKNFREENAGATKQAAKDIVNRKSD